MDGENNGKPTLKMDDLGGKPTIFGNIHTLFCKNYEPISSLNYGLLQEFFWLVIFYGFDPMRFIVSISPHHVGGMFWMEPFESIRILKKKTWIPSPKHTWLPLKEDAWKTMFLLGNPISPKLLIEVFLRKRRYRKELYSLRVASLKLTASLHLKKWMVGTDPFSCWDSLFFGVRSVSVTPSITWSNEWWRENKGMKCVLLSFLVKI